MKYALCLHSIKLCLYFDNSVAPKNNWYNCVASLVLHGPLEVGIGRNVIGRHCRPSLMINNVGGARIRTFFKLVDCQLKRSFVSEAFFGLTNASE